MPKYGVELEDGRRFGVEVDEEIDVDSPDGQARLQQAVEAYLRHEAMERTPALQAAQGALHAGASFIDTLTEFVNPTAPHPERPRAVPPVTPPDALALSAQVERGMHPDAVVPLLRQVGGGMRDATQQALDVPAQVANVITEFISPDAPGGPRQRVVPEVQAPQLPDVEPPTTPVERGVRLVSHLATTLATALLAPDVAERVLIKLGLLKVPRGVPLMFEPGASAAKSVPAGQKPTPTMAVPSGVLTGELSAGAANTAKVLGLPHTMASIRAMTQAEAAAARAKLIDAVGDAYELVAESGTPAAELYQAIEQQLLRYR
jgi:hypothetical protein